MAVARRATTRGNPRTRFAEKPGKHDIAFRGLLGSIYRGAPAKGHRRGLSGHLPKHIINLDVTGFGGVNPGREFFRRHR